MPYRAVLLDFDGLVCDTESAALRSWRETFAAHGHTFGDRTWARMVGSADGERHAAADLSRLLGREVPGEVLVRRRALKRELCDREPLRPGVLECLAGADERGVPVAAVSSSPASWVEHHLARLEVLGRFAAVVARGGAEAPKPAPDLYLRALDELGVPAADAIACEDSAAGVRAAKRAGLLCATVPNGAAVGPPPAEADSVLSTVAEIWTSPKGART